MMSLHMFLTTTDAIALVVLVIFGVICYITYQEGYRKGQEDAENGKWKLSL